MTSRSDFPPRDPKKAFDALVDELQGALDDGEGAALEARLAADPRLAAERASLHALAGAEREVFETAAQHAAAEADAPRLAAWVRSRVLAEETEHARAARRTPARRTPARRGWARVLAWSVAAHVVLLGVLAFLLAGEAPQTTGLRSARVALDGLDEGEDGLIADGYGAGRDLADTALALRYDRIAWDDHQDALGDRLALAEPGSRDLREDLERFDEEAAGSEAPQAWEGLSHPVGVLVAMSRRTKPELKRRRLQLLGFNAKGTLKAVDRGLRFLGRQQTTVGAFRAAGEPSVDATALVLLAFLGNGHTSRGHGERDGVVRKGVAWLRARLFDDAHPDALTSARPAGVGAATMALCEDYMLSYGDLPPRSAQHRARELAALAAAARERLKHEKGDERTWDVWALDATARAGIVTTSALDEKVFQAWVATASAAAPAAGSMAGSMASLRQGTALLFAERGASKPRFLDWSRANAEPLVRRLYPTGQARSGDPVRETATILLALQVSYRTY